MSKETIKTYRQKRKTDLIYIMGGKCQICGYNKCEAALEFHHCNSNEKDFNLSNGNCRSLEKDLREARKCILLCANCHREVEYNNLKLNPVFNEEKAKEVIERNSIKKIYCADCGKKITSGAIRCEECSQKARRKVERPSREELKELIYTLPFTTIGKQFGVTDNAIRKWCIQYGLPSKKREIKQYDKKEWEKI